MFLPFVLVTVASLLFLVYKFKSRDAEKSGKKKLKGNYWVILKGIFDFLFRVKSEDRLNSFKLIHKLFPKFARFKFLNSDNIIVYDPELCKKVYSAQSACQRPFRNCFQLEYGLLSSECTNQNKFLIFTVNNETKFYFRKYFCWLISLVNCNWTWFSDHYWKVSRKHLNLAFHLNVLKGFIPIFYSYADGVVKDMEKNLDGKEFDLLFPLAQLTARSVAG